MASIPVLTKFVSKPLRCVLDKRNSLSRGLIFAFPTLGYPLSTLLNSQGAMTELTGNFTDNKWVTAAPSIRPRSFGLGYDFQLNNASDLINFSQRSRDLQPTNFGSGFTIQALVAISDPGSNAVFFDYENNVVQHLRLGIVSASSAIYFQNEGAGTISSTDTINHNTPNGYYNIIVVYDAVNLKINFYFNGKPDSGNPHSTPAVTYTNDVLNDVNIYGMQVFFDYKIWKRSLTQQEINQLSADPFRLYRPSTSFIVNYLKAKPPLSIILGETQASNDPRLLNDSVVKTESQSSLDSKSLLDQLRLSIEAQFMSDSIFYNPKINLLAEILRSQAWLRVEKVQGGKSDPKWTGQNPT